MPIDVGTDGKPNEKRKQTIIAISGVLVVLLTYLLYRHSQNAAAANQLAQQGSPTMNPTSSGVQPVDSSAADNLLSNISNQMNQLIANSSVTGSSPKAASVGSIPTSTALHDRGGPWPGLHHGPNLSPQQAQLRAVYDNVFVHLQAAQKQYNAAPNQSNATLVHNYQAHARQAQQAYLASLSSPTRTVAV